MSTSVRCPDLAELLQFARNEITGAEGAELWRHLTLCPSCREQLRDLPDGQPLLRVLDLLDSTASASPGSAQASPQETIASDPAASVRSGDSGPGHTSELLALLRPPLEPDELGSLGTYRVLKVLGSGGMGTVFLAEDIHLRRPVALKLMSPRLMDDLTARERFLQEARAMAQVKSDHIVTVYQVGQLEDIPFLAMELLDGETVEDRLRRAGRLSVGDTVRMAGEIAEGLALAHERGIIHRDIKPSNLWLERPKDRVKILDFGLVQLAGRHVRLTSPTQVVGTPQYMAPEQARGEPLDARTDLFSLGAVLYEMLTGRSAFQGSTVMAVLTALASQDPHPVELLAPDVPPPLAQLIRDLLAKDPSRRPASAREVQARLAALAAVSPSTPPSQASGSARVPSGGLDAAEPQTGSYRPLHLVGGALAILTLAVLAGLAGWSLMSGDAAPETTAPAASGSPVRVGILQSTSGTLGDAGSAVVDATLLAIEEVNAAGGIKGRPVEAVFRDGQSDPEVHARAAEQLITREQVCTIFGCWTSSSRKAVAEVVERHDHLLVYPLQYEGLEESPNIIYNGAAPNQQILPAVRHCYSFLRKRHFFLVGSDYLFSRAANAIIRDELASLGAEVVGEEYLRLGSEEAAGLIQKVVAAKPDVILNTINGDSNRSFYRGLRGAGITSDQVPTVSFSISENELRGLGLKEMAGELLAWSYFQSVATADNTRFVEKMRARYGPQRVTGDPMAAAYLGVHLWADAAREADALTPTSIREALRGRRFRAPEGEVWIDPESLHTWKFFRLGKVRPDGQVEILWSTGDPIEPEPFPPSRTREQWQAFLTDLHRQLGPTWQR